jgi:ABC-type polysaccharide/polyol phosphate export permease
VKIWNHTFLLQNLVLKDFRIRYRNMSLGVLWSVVNPLVMMGVLTFIFTRVFPNRAAPNFAVFVLCALVPFNFYSLSLNAGTTSLLENQSLIKRVRCPREIFPIAAVLSNCLHFLIQIGLLIIFVFAFGYSVNRYWLWLPVLWVTEVVFMCGLVLSTSVLDIYYRDIRYLVEASSVVMFWAVPIFYSFSVVPARYKLLYLLNPISVVAMAGRSVLMDGKSPTAEMLFPFFVVSFAFLLIGFAVFARLKRDMADYL